MDARRVRDGAMVWLKYVGKNTPEIPIGGMLSHPAVQNDPLNHTTPLLEVIELEEDSDHAILAFPLLRSILDPLPQSIRECLDFMDQTLEVSSTCRSIYLMPYHDF